MLDLTVLGKAVVVGFPISGVCGRREVFETMSSRRMAHVGTFNGKSVCAAAAVSAVRDKADLATTRAAIGRAAARPAAASSA